MLYAPHTIVTQQSFICCFIMEGTCSSSPCYRSTSFFYPLGSNVVASVVAIVAASFRSGTPREFVALQVVERKLIEWSPYPSHPYTTNKTPHWLVSANFETLCGFIVTTVDCSIHPCWSCHDYYHHCRSWFCEQVCDLCAMIQPGKCTECATGIEYLLLATLIALAIFVQSLFLRTLEINSAHGRLEYTNYQSMASDSLCPLPHTRRPPANSHTTSQTEWTESTQTSVRQQIDNSCRTLSTTVANDRNNGNYTPCILSYHFIGVLVHNYRGIQIKNWTVYQGQRLSLLATLHPTNNTNSTIRTFLDMLTS